MKTAFFHQTHFLPWPGYIARCLDSDLVIFLNDVKFNKGYYHNRCKIINRHGTDTWLTMPVNNKTINGCLASVQIAERPLLKKWFRRFRLAYQSSQEFKEIWEYLELSFLEHYPSLDKFNRQMIRWIIAKVCENLGRNVPQYQESDRYTVASTDKTQRLLTISNMFDIDRILMGSDSFCVHDIKQLASSNITSVRHVHCSDPLSGNYSDTVAPLSGVTLLHYVLTEGWESSSLQLINDWGVAPITPSSISSI